MKFQQKKKLKLLLPINGWPNRTLVRKDIIDVKFNLRKRNSFLYCFCYCVEESSICRQNMSRSLSLIFTAFLLLELVSQQRTRLFASAFKLRPSHGPFNTAPDRSIQAVKSSLKTLLASLVVLLPLSVSATPLGEHTVCSYPACTSQAEILLNTAPNLVSKEETDRLYGILASIQKFLQAYPSYLENQVLCCILVIRIYTVQYIYILYKCTVLYPLAFYNTNQRSI